MNKNYRTKKNISKSKSENFEYYKIKNFLISDNENENIKYNQLKVIECQISRLQDKSDNLSIINLNSNRKIKNESDNFEIIENKNDNSFENTKNKKFNKKYHSYSNDEIPNNSSHKLFNHMFKYMNKINSKEDFKSHKNFKLNLRDDDIKFENSNDSNSFNDISNKRKIENDNYINEKNNSKDKKNNIINLNLRKKSLSISIGNLKKIENSSDIIEEKNLNFNSSFFEEIKNDNIKTSIKIKIKFFCNNVLKLFKQKVYIFCVLSVSVFNFISTAIQYWVSDHLSKVMKFEENEIFICFVITCVTAPALGVISGGYIVQKFGGYEVKKSIIICLIFSITASIIGIFIVIPEDIIGFSFVLWIYLFFGGAVIPNLIGKRKK